MNRASINLKALKAALNTIEVLSNSKNRTLRNCKDTLGSINDQVECAQAHIMLFENEEDNRYDYINPEHYKNYSKEVIDMMVDIYGPEATAMHCEMTAFKYRMRAGTKPDQPVERDFSKEKWYLDKAKELRTKINK